MKNSVHLQNFPDISFLNNEKNLIAEMDMVRAVCSSALFVRDQKNLRVRLPLNKLTIIGKNAASMLIYKDIIADEVNVKNVEIIEEIGNLAEIRLQINFKKIGAKLGPKIKDITNAAKEGKWEKISDNKIKIIDEILSDDEFEIKLITKNSENITALPTNDCLVELDINVTKELEEEGLARDVIRAIQQNRKDADLDVSNHIEVAIFSQNQQLLEIIKNHQSYIKEQTLTDEITIVSEVESIKKYPHHFNNKIEDFDWSIGFGVISKL